MDKTEVLRRHEEAIRPERAEIKYRTTFLFVAVMLAGFIVGWACMLMLVLKRY